MLPKKGIVFPNDKNLGSYPRAMAYALKRELGSTHQAIKIIMRSTGGSGAWAEAITTVSVRAIAARAANAWAEGEASTAGAGVSAAARRSLTQLATMIAEASQGSPAGLTCLGIFTSERSEEAMRPGGGNIMPRAKIGARSAAPVV